MAQIKFILLKRRGDDRIENYFKSINTAEGKPLLNIKTIMIDSAISSYSLLNRIDTTQACCYNRRQALMKLLPGTWQMPVILFRKNIRLVLIGMPNWDGFKSLTKTDRYKDFPIRYTTPHL